MVSTLAPVSVVRKKEEQDVHEQNHNKLNTIDRNNLMRIPYYVCVCTNYNHSLRALLLGRYIYNFFKNEDDNEDES